MCLINAENILQTVRMEHALESYGGLNKMLKRDRLKCLQNTETSNTVSLIVMGVRLEVAKKTMATLSVHQ